MDLTQYLALLLLAEEVEEIQPHQPPWDKTEVLVVELTDTIRHPSLAQEFWDKELVEDDPLVALLLEAAVVQELLVRFLLTQIIIVEAPTAVMDFLPI
jgi:hypothetical protein